MQAVVKVAPALAAGCALLLKPSPLASLSCLQLEAIATEAGLPHPYPYPYPYPNPNPKPQPKPKPKPKPNPIPMSIEEYLARRTTSP